MRTGWQRLENQSVEINEVESPQSKTPPPSLPSQPDGYLPGFLDAEKMLRQVIEAFPTRPDDGGDVRILEAALGEVPLDEKSVQQIWLTLGYWWWKDKNRKIPAQTNWILTAVCFYANSRRISIPTPNVFGFMDDIKFRTL